MKRHLDLMVTTQRRKRESETCRTNVKCGADGFEFQIDTKKIERKKDTRCKGIDRIESTFSITTIVLTIYILHAHQCVAAQDVSFARDRSATWVGETSTNKMGTFHVEHRSDVVYKRWQWETQARIRNRRKRERWE